MNPAVKEREVAEWRFGASGIEHILFEQDKDILSQHNIPGGIKVDFYCHDYLCFALFLRNKYPLMPNLLAYNYNEDDSKKFRVPENNKKLKGSGDKLEKGK